MLIKNKTFLWKCKSTAFWQNHGIHGIWRKSRFPWLSTVPIDVWWTGAAGDQAPHKLCGIIIIKGELNPKIKLDLNDSFCTLINRYNPHNSNSAWFERNFQISKSFYLLTNYAKK